MSEQSWSKVDDYVTEMLGLRDAALDRAVAAAEQAQLPAIAVTPPQGMLLHIIALIQGAQRILEIGTLGGYSTIWLARALPPRGRLISLEVDPRCAQTAKASIESAGLRDRVEVLLGPALQTLQRMHSEGVEPFDLVFIDADKPSTPDYFQWALRHSRPGGLIIADNVVIGGALADADTTDVRAQGGRRLHEMIAAEPMLKATTIQTVGAKRHDGFTLVRLDAEPDT